MHPVEVTHQGNRWTLLPGDRLTAGRARSCDVRLPDDDHLSRRAWSLQVLDDCVVVRNDSTTKPLVVRPPTGEDRVVEPGAATTSLPYREFSVVVAGRGGHTVVADVDARGLPPAVRLAGGPATSTSVTVTAPVTLTGAQQRVLVALCAPLLTRSGPEAAPATYAQVGERLGLSPAYVRNVLKTLRETLSGCGVPGLTGDDPKGSPEDYRWPLARWAVRSGWVTSADLDEESPRA